MRFLAEFLETSVPCLVSTRDGALDNPRRHAALLAVPGDLVHQSESSPILSTLGVLLDFADYPVIYSGRTEQPLLAFTLLSRTELQFQLSLDHFVLFKARRVCRGASLFTAFAREHRS